VVAGVGARCGFWFWFSFWLQALGLGDWERVRVVFRGGTAGPGTNEGGEGAYGLLVTLIGLRGFWPGFLAFFLKFISFGERCLRVVLASAAGRL
jgi:hypothetical protein